MTKSSTELFGRTLNVSVFLENGPITPDPWYKQSSPLWDLWASALAAIPPEVAVLPSVTIVVEHNGGSYLAAIAAGLYPLGNVKPHEGFKKKHVASPTVSRGIGD